MMNKTCIYLLLALPVGSLWAQCTIPTDTETLDANNLEVGFLNGGDMFWDALSSPKFYHKIDGAHTLFASALWMGAWDEGGNLCLSAQTYRSVGTDYWAGPLDTTSLPLDTTCTDFNRIWKVERTEIEALLTDYYDNYTIDQPVANNLLIWPGHGNPHFAALMGFQLPDRDLAPYHDNNGDNVYNPHDGDYPIYEENNAQAVADQMLWMVFNDKANIHTATGGQPLAAEIGLMAYSFDCSANPLLHNTIFTKYTIRSFNSIRLRDMRIGLWADFDLGYYGDDLLGCSPTHNSIYAYNATDYDNISDPLAAGFGAHPPVQAITLLNQTMASNAIFANSGSPTVGEPSSALGYYRVMDAHFINGTPYMHNGDSVDFIFPDAPSDTAGWNMLTDPGFIGAADHRQVSVIDIGDFMPGSVHTIDVAYSYHRDTTLHSPAAMVDLMLQELPQLQQIYDNGFQLPCTVFSGIIEEVMDGKNDDQTGGNTQIQRIYPNPAQDVLNIELKTTVTTPVNCILYDAMGKVVHQQTLSPTGKLLQVSDLQLLPGLYFFALDMQGVQLGTGKVAINR